MGSKTGFDKHFLKSLRELKSNLTNLDISGAVAGYLTANPVTAAWEAITGKPEVFPPDAHLHPELAIAEHDHDLSYSPLGHTHPGGSDGEVSVVLTEDRTTNSTSYQDVTGLSFNADANSVYLIESYLVFQSNNTTYGIGFSINGPSSPGYCVGHVDTMLAANTRTIQNIIAYGNSNTTSGTVVAINTNYPAFLWCLLKTGDNAGTVSIRFRSENAAGTVKVVAGSCIRYRKVA